MINKIKFFLSKLRRKYKTFRLRKYYKEDTSDFFDSLKNNKADTLILTVAFNNELVIEKQIELISKFCKDNFFYLVADNSTDEEKKDKIKKICNYNNICYFSLPSTNPFNNYDPSASHGASLNYLWKNIIFYLDNINYFMILDHDIFPTSIFSVKEMMKKQYFYGLVKERKFGWYLWPGFSCFSRQYLLDKKVDFLPSKYGDTGSANYLSIYQYFNLNNINKATDVYIDLDIEDVDDNDMYIDQKNRLELIDSHWIHLINAANWAGIDGIEQKFNKMLELINKKVNE